MSNLFVCNDLNISEVTKFIRSIIVPIIRYTSKTSTHDYSMPISTTSNIQSYLSAHVARNENSHIYFDSDAVEIVLDLGCSFSILFCAADFINLKPSDGDVTCLGVHKIKGEGTVKYTVLDEHGNKIDILIQDALYVSTLSTRLLFLQQLAQKSSDPRT